MMGKVLITTSTFGQLDDSPIKKLKAAGFDVQLNPFKRKLTKEESFELLPGVVGLIAGLEVLDYEVLSKSDLKVLSRCGAGMSNVDINGAEKLDIQIYNTPDGPMEAVAELTLGCLLSVMRASHQMSQQLHEGKWTKIIGTQLKGKTVVIIGYGHIGRRVAELLKPFQVNLKIVDPFIKDKIEDVDILDLEKALAIADVISLHCSGEECLLSAKHFDLMKEGVFVLNGARGNLIDEKVLIKNLDNGKVKGVWMDAFSEEPYKGDLINFPQVLLTPHVGSYSAECRQYMEMQSVNNLLEGLKRFNNGFK